MLSPPVGEIAERTDDDSRSNRRPIELPWLDLRTAEPQYKGYDAAVSRPHSIIVKGLECCADPLSIVNRSAPASFNLLADLG